MSDALTLQEAARAWQRCQELHLNYHDLHGRVSRYLCSSELPPEFSSGRWTTHRRGLRWTRAHLLDIFAQLPDKLPPSVPKHGWDCFLPCHLTDKCMVVRKFDTYVASRLGAPDTTPRIYVYRDSDKRIMVRPWSDWQCHRDQPCMVAFRLLMWLVWGPPPELESGQEVIACHMCCDHHLCINPTHGRWGTHSENLREHHAFKKVKELRDRLPPHHAAAFYRRVHPARCLLYAQGFWPRHRIFPDTSDWKELD